MSGSVQSRHVFLPRRVRRELFERPRISRRILLRRWSRHRGVSIHSLYRGGSSFPCGKSGGVRDVVVNMTKKSNSKGSAFAGEVGGCFNGRIIILCRSGYGAGTLSVYEAGSFRN